MENNKSLLMAILCGVGACFFCMGIVFLLPKNNEYSNVDLSEVEEYFEPGENVDMADEYNVVNFYTADGGRRIATCYIVGSDLNCDAEPCCATYSYSGGTLNKAEIFTRDWTGHESTSYTCADPEPYCYDPTPTPIPATPTPTPTPTPTATPTPTPTPKYSFCCVKDNKYQWLTNQSSKVCPEGYSIDETKNSSTCKTAPACYICTNDEYVWGEYSNDDNCRIVPSITEQSQCKNVIPVKPTGVSVSAIIYACIAALMAFGIAFIYYSTILKQNK